MADRSSGCEEQAGFVGRDVRLSIPPATHDVSRMTVDSRCDHPEITDFDVVWLCCEPAMVSFYEKWGFQFIDDGRTWMHRLNVDSFPDPEGGPDA